MRFDITLVGLLVILLACLMPVSAHAQNAEKGAFVVNPGDDKELTLRVFGIGIYQGEYVFVNAGNGHATFHMNAKMRVGNSPDKPLLLVFDQELPIYGVNMSFKCRLLPAGRAQCDGKEAG